MVMLNQCHHEPSELAQGWDPRGGPPDAARGFLIYVFFGADAHLRILHIFAHVSE